MGKLWGAFCEDFRENWPHYNGTSLYICVTQPQWYRPWPWCCCNPFSEWLHSFQWKLCSHWLKVLPQHQIAEARSEWYGRRLSSPVILSPHYGDSLPQETRPVTRHTALRFNIAISNSHLAPRETLTGEGKKFARSSYLHEGNYIACKMASLWWKDHWLQPHVSSPW